MAGRIYKLRIILLLCLILLSGCHHHTTWHCDNIYYSSQSCGDTCISTATQQRALEAFIITFNARHGDGDKVAKVLHNLQITWADGDGFFDQMAPGHKLSGITYNTRAIKVACKDGVLGHTAFSWELMCVSMWTLTGHPCERAKYADPCPEWTEEHSRTVSIVNSMFAE